MLSQANRGEDIEFYADRFEERQEVLQKYHEEGGANPSETADFPEESVKAERQRYLNRLDSDSSSYDPIAHEFGTPPTLSEAEDGELVGTGSEGIEHYEIRKLSNRYFAVFPGIDRPTLMSEGKAHYEEAERTAKEIARLITPVEHEA